MPYLSELVLNPNARNSFFLLGDSYNFHQWLLAAFPDKSSGGAGRVLYRVEPRGNNNVVLVQSTKEPFWRQPEIMEVRGPKIVCGQGNPFYADQLLRFKLRANPTVCRDGKRHVWQTEQEQRMWLTRKGLQHGFSVGDGENVLVAGRQTFYGKKGRGTESAPITIVGIDFEGLLKVTDPTLFLQAIEGGIGAAKGFGCGLLSVALPWR